MVKIISLLKWQVFKSITEPTVSIPMIKFKKKKKKSVLFMIYFTGRTLSSECYSLGQMEVENPIFLMSQMRERPASIIIDEMFELDTALMITGKYLQ